MLTGHRPDRSFFVEGINRKPHADDWPFIGSVGRLGAGRNRELPGVVQLPARSGEVTGYINPGQFAACSARPTSRSWCAASWTSRASWPCPQFALPADVDAARLDGRRDLLGQLDAWQRRLERGGTLDAYDTHQRKAFALLDLATGQAGVRPAPGAGSRPRPLRRRHQRPERAAGPAAGRGGRAVRLRPLDRPQGRRRPQLGHAQRQLRPAEERAAAGVRRLLLGPARRPGDARPARRDAGRRRREMGRTPKVGDPRTGGKGRRAATTGSTARRPCSPAAASAAARSTAPPTGRRLPRRPTRSAPSTWRRRSITRWASPRRPDLHRPRGPARHLAGGGQPLPLFG